MKWYDVTVTFGPETLRVQATSEEAAKRRAAFVIGYAGFETVSTYEVRDVTAAQREHPVMSP